MATSTEVPDYINEQPRHGEKSSINTNQTERRIPQLLLLSFGVLCIIQAVLNISLRLSLNSGQVSDPFVCNATTNQSKKTDVVVDCKRKTPSGFNSLQNRFNALTKETDLRIRKLEEERDKLKWKIRDQSDCASSQQCPTDWIERNSRCYFQSGYQLTWEESRNYCKSKGADLAVINSEQELIFLGHLNRCLPWYWIGLHQTNGEFRWVDGSALTKESWDPDALRSSYKCVVMNFFKSVQTSWIKAPCQEKNFWLCETDLCPPSR
ncbi:C-type lectin domain family 10 member A-like [Limanda limanda]|uniref:C-type lectin domain family 10 member A-like n=1 Tax=Limanda limanda TaxID=27771 RepID=UPI0029C76942|nr:C-type lectin domain family 10 member A-like [Limanda limanda]